MTTKNRTIAEQVASRLGGDGQVFEVPAREGEPVDDGAREEGHTSLDVLARAAGATREREGASTRYAFRDGSTIVDSEGAAWDLSFPRCWCWIAGGHHDDCPERDRCSVPGCEREAYSSPTKGRYRRQPLCEAHYRRAIRGSRVEGEIRSGPGGEGLTVRLTEEVRRALGPNPSARAREILTEWARRQR